ncbi:MAG: GtrA family protein [Firmicutes bacterium]|nr:GtrA family protein [Bacillota bacterium]
MSVPDWLTRLLRFGIVGMGGVGVNFLTFRAVLAVLPHWPVVANAVAVEVSIVGNYLGNARFTFHHPWRWSALGRYNLASAGAFAVQVGVFTALLHWGWPRDWADLLAIPCGTLLTFVMSTGWVFRAREGGDDGAGGRRLGGAGGSR